MYSLQIRPTLKKKLTKLAKKNKRQAEIILRKTEEILKDPQRYKNLRRPLQEHKRVHIDAHFVLIFSVDESTKSVTLEDFDHHDVIYKTK